MHVARAETNDALAKQYFQKGQYEKAKKYYLQAYTTDKSNPALIYNLAVVHYKLQQYPQAKSYFSALLPNSSYRFLARYNLGLVAYHSGQKQEAINAFKLLADDRQVQTDTDRKIQALAQNQLALLTQETVKSKKISVPSKPQAYLAAHLGYEDNLLDPLGQSLTTGDDFIETIASIKFPIQGNARKGLNLGLELYSKDYESFSEYNFLQVAASLTQSYTQARWLYQAGLELSQSTYGSYDYLETSQLELQARYKIKPLSKLQLRFRYSEMISRDILFTPYEGNQQRLGLTYDWRQGQHRIKAGVEIEWNDLADYQSGANYTSYSATRNKLEVSWYYRINADNKLRLKTLSRKSEYHDLNTLDFVVRDDHLDIFSVLYQSRISKNWWLEMQYKQSDNDSNISRYDYSRNITSIGISGFF